MNNVRSWSLLKFDSVLSRCFPYPLRSYKTRERRKTYTSPLSLQLFVKEHGYFSYAPLLSSVSGDEKDLMVVQRALKSAIEVDTDWLDFCVSEILCKALAYRDVSLHQEINIPILNSQNQIVLRPFILNRVFDLWQKMPAFGWIPKDPNTPSLLIFRGTDCSLFSKRSLASLISDLDIHGPGFRVFKRSQSQISEWLESVRQRAKAARVMGCSLGGALATYVFIEYHHLLGRKPSVAFHPPGVCKKVKKNWDQLEGRIQEQLITYIAQGDFVSKVRSLVGSKYILSVNTKLKPLAAHTLLFSGQPQFICQSGHK